LGIALWIVAGCAAFAVTRPVGIARTRWPGEFAASIAAAVALGIVATVLDFGGWNEADWRAGVLALCGALTAVAAVRLAGLTRRDVSESAASGRSAR